MAEQNNIPVLSVDSGVMLIDVNDNGKVIGQIEFNPSDIGMLRRHDEVVDFMNG